MRQSYSEIEETTNCFKEIVKEKGLAQVQKIVTTPHYICMQARVRGMSVFLYLGRGFDYFGIHLFEGYVPSEFRLKKDKTVEYFKKEVKGKSIARIEISRDHPIIELVLRNRDKEIHLFWAKGDAGTGFLLQDPDKKECFTSWGGAIPVEKAFAAIQDYVKDRRWPPAGEKRAGISEYFKSLEAMSISGKKRTKRRKKVESKLKKIEADIQRLENVKTIKNDLIENNYSLDENFDYLGLRVKFPKSYSDFQRRDKLFIKLKDWQAALDIQIERRRLVEKELHDLEREKPRADMSLIKTIKVDWGSDKKRKKISDGETQKKEFDVIKCGNGCSIGIGKSSSGNDELRKYWGKKDDYWFHIDGEKGSHLVLKGELGPHLFDLIGSILRDYSGYSGLEIPVVYSQLSKIKGVKGQRGAVTISKPRYFQARYLSDWKEIISRMSSRPAKS